ncbi:MAG: Gfo/Idh/MocA family oxidoreductase [Candidatus Methylacidiphilales bacterium]
MRIVSVFAFAIIGTGSIAPTHAKALAALPNACLDAVCDLDRARAEAFATEFPARVLSWNEILQDPSIDAAILCTPSGTHADLAVALLLAGKHVVAEKPMDITACACDRIVAACETSGKIFTVISQHRFDPAAQEVHRLIQEGRLGRIFGVEARIPWFRTQDYYDSGDWRGTWALDGGGCLINQGVHTLDLALWFGGKARSVFARALQATHQRIEVEDHLCATLELETGAIGTLLASTSVYPGFPARIEVFGTDGSAILEGDELHTLAIKGEPTRHGQASAHAAQVASGGTKTATEQSRTQALAQDKWVWGDAHRAQLHDFIQACRLNRPPAISAQEGRHVVATIEAIYQSARTGQPCSVH